MTLTVWQPTISKHERNRVMIQSSCYYDCSSAECEDAQLWILYIFVTWYDNENYVEENNSITRVIKTNYFIAPAINKQHDTIYATKVRGDIIGSTYTLANC